MFERKRFEFIQTSNPLSTEYSLTLQIQYLINDNNCIFKN